MKSLQRGILRRHVTAVFLAGLCAFLAGCAMGRTPPPPPEQYVIEYPPPERGSARAIRDAIRVERFGASQEFGSYDMIYRPAAYKREVDFYHRWRVPPADMITDFLVRDLRQSGVFDSVFSYQDSGAARYRLDGDVVEFLEIGEAGKREAALGVHVTLFDGGGGAGVPVLIWDKTYHLSEPVREPTVDGFVTAMSKATERFSRTLLADMVQAICGDAAKPATGSKKTK